MKIIEKPTSIHKKTKNEVRGKILIMSSLNVLLFVVIGDHHVRAAGLQVYLVCLRKKTTVKIKGQETPNYITLLQLKMWILVDSK